MTHKIENVSPNGEASCAWYLPDSFDRRPLRIVLNDYQRDLHEEILRRVLECILAKLLVIVDRSTSSQNSISDRHS